MPSRSLTVHSVTIRGGRAYVRWSDQSEDEFGSKQEVTDFVRREFEDAENVKRIMKVLALARYLRLDPGMNNPALIEGRTITLTNETNAVGVIV